MLFELFNVFVIFQTKINKTLQKLINYLYVIYLNNILIYFKTKKKHWQIVRQIFENLRKFKFFVNLIKYIFIIQFVEFLKFIINNYKRRLVICYILLSAILNNNSWRPEEQVIIQKSL